MRDVLVTIVIFGLIPPIFKYPWTGVLLFAWISIFSPHRYAYGFANDFPFAMIVGAVTVFSMLLNLKQVRLPINGITLLLMALPFWMTVTLLFALEPAAALVRWEEVMKTFLFILISAALLHSRKQLEIFLWVIVASVGFYGIKGGIFTLLAGGGEKVYGPPGDSFLSDNNAIAAALIMTIPLMQFLSTTVSSKWIRFGLYAAMLLSGLAILGTFSRGAFVGLMMMALFLWFKSKRKILLGLLLLPAIILSIGFMPASWTSRMDTIGTYEQDTSAMGRINTWLMAINLANDRPLVGGGFEPYEAKTFARYAPDPTDIHAAHSIYFQMLGEHGYVGLALFVWLGLAAWMTARRIIKMSPDGAPTTWEAGLARAIQVSLVGYATAGAFVNISYWDFPYYEIVILMASALVARAAAAKPAEGTAARAGVAFNRV
ncbi:MAG: putative O-glycosylation ligase, exosortase A system-associated [Betaproteobacteria bacterium]